MEPVGLPAHSLLPTLPTPPETAQWWFITPSPMAFENIGFTRPVQALSQSQGMYLHTLLCKMTQSARPKTPAKSSSFSHALSVTWGLWVGARRAERNFGLPAPVLGTGSRKTASTLEIQFKATRTIQYTSCRCGLYNSL